MPAPRWVVGSPRSTTFWKGLDETFNLVYDLYLPDDPGRPCAGGCSSVRSRRGAPKSARITDLDHSEADHWGRSLNRYDWILFENGDSFSGWSHLNAPNSRESSLESGWFCSTIFVSSFWRPVLRVLRVLRMSVLPLNYHFTFWLLESLVLSHTSGLLCPVHWRTWAIILWSLQCSGKSYGKHSDCRSKRLNSILLFSRRKNFPIEALSVGTQMESSVIAPFSCSG